MKNFAFLAALIAISLAGDEEIGMKTDQVILHWGYPLEIVKATTADGYILTMHRIPYGRNGANPYKRRPVVFLQHGLECSSSNFVTMLPEKALGFMLADSGYDVWMGNVRGNLYSIEHQTLNVKGHDFWKFSWQDITKYDLTAMIDKALQVTNHSSLYYVGHSQGTLTMFAKLSSDQAFAAKIKKFFALAPVGTVAHIQGLLGFLARDFYYGFEILFGLLGTDQFLPDNAFTKIVENLFCMNPITDGICDCVLFLIAGPESNQFNTTRVPVYITDLPSGTSTRNVIHWAQMARSKKVQMYDYENSKENIKNYGQSVPPVYDFSKIAVDTYLYWGNSDILATKDDIQGYLIPTMNPKYLKQNNQLADFNHLDFLWGERAPNEIYKPIIDVINADVAGP